MAIKFDPPPIQDKENSESWKNWFVQLKRNLSTLSSLSWGLIDFTGSNITSIVNRNHNDLTSKQGGTTNEYYHITSSQSSSLSSGLSVTVTLAKITGGGTNGSLTFTNGVLTSKVDPT